MSAVVNLRRHFKDTSPLLQQIKKKNTAKATSIQPSKGHEQNQKTGEFYNFFSRQCISQRAVRTSLEKQ